MAQLSLWLWLALLPCLLQSAGHAPFLQPLAVEAGCDGSDAEKWDCLFRKWYHEIDRRAHSRPGYEAIEMTYGEVLPRGVAAMLDMLEAMGAPLAVDDAFYDLGSGTGKIVLQAALGTRVGSAIGIELDEHRHNDGVAILQSLSSKLSIDRIGLVHGDVTDIELWSNASVIVLTSTLFPMAVMTRLVTGFEQQLPPGAVVMTLRAFSGCRRSLRLLGSVAVPTSWHPEVPAWVYVVPPVQPGPLPPWFSGDRVKELGERLALISDEATLPLSECVSRFAAWWGSRVSSLTRGLLTAGAPTASWPAASPPPVRLPASKATVQREDLLAGARHHMRGLHKSLVECAYEETLTVLRVGSEEALALARSFAAGGWGSDDGGKSLAHRAVWLGNERASQALEVFLDAGFPIDGRDAEGNSLLHEAAGRGHLAMAQVLLERSAQSDAKNGRGQTPAELLQERADMLGSNEQTVVLGFLLGKAPGGAVQRSDSQEL